MRRIEFFSRDSRQALLVGVPVLAVLALVAVAVVAPGALAGSPHFVSNTVTATRTDNSLTVSGKEAGLGDEAGAHRRHGDGGVHQRWKQPPKGREQDLGLGRG